MAKYRITHLARQDLNEIWEYTFNEWSIKQADKYYELLITSFNEIAIDPNCGKSYEDVEPRLKGLRIGKHIIFFELIDENLVGINRVLHQKMEIKNRLKN